MSEQEEQNFHDELKEIWSRYQDRMPAGTLCGIVLALSANWTFESAPTIKVAQQMLRRSITVMKGRYIESLKLKER